jgi:ATP-dependent DNA helicase RecG
VSRRAPTLPGIDGEKDDAQKSSRRLQTMVETTDGFKIAEIDLEIRGPGEFFGTRQSGLPQLQLANLMTDGALLLDARSEAYRIIEEDPHLRRADHANLRSYYDERLADAMTMVQGG